MMSQMHKGQDVLDAIDRAMAASCGKRWRKAPCCELIFSRRNQEISVQ